MGLFNQVDVICPNCGKSNYLQSKGGSCEMATSALEQAELGDQVEVAGEHFCQHCGDAFEVIIQSIATVRRR